MAELSPCGRIRRVPPRCNRRQAQLCDPARWAGLCWARVRWFYRKEDTAAAKSKVAPVSGVDPLNDAEIAEKEVFASCAEDDNLLSTVDGVRHAAHFSFKPPSSRAGCLFLISFRDTREQVAQLYKVDDVTDWSSLRTNSNSVFVRRMYK